MITVIMFTVKYELRPVLQPIFYSFSALLRQIFFQSSNFLSIHFLRLMLEIMQESLIKSYQYV